MRTVNIHEAKTHLSKLVEQAANGEAVVIAKAGKPVAKLVAVDAPEPRQMRRRGFLAGQISVPEDFNTMFEKEILEIFGIEP